MRRILGVLLASFICVGPVQADEEDRSFFSISAAPHPALIVKWHVVQRRIADDEARLAACRADTATCSDDELRFAAIVAAGRSREGRARIGEINRAVNLAIRPVSDERRFGVADNWSSPLETLSDGAGDCEDYAILKILALRHAGVASADLKLLIVYDRPTRSAHAVVAVRLDERWLVLDNRRFAMVPLEFTEYRLMATLDPETQHVNHASLDAASFDAESVDGTRDVM